MLEKKLKMEDGRFPKLPIKEICNQIVKGQEYVTICTFVGPMRYQILKFPVNKYVLVASLKTLKPGTEMQLKYDKKDNRYTLMC